MTKDCKHCVTADVISVSPKDDSEETKRIHNETVRDLDVYLRAFAAPIKAEAGDCLNCLQCGDPLTGFMSMFLGRGGFTWGLAHGEGFCKGCKWPGRAYHNVKDRDGNDLVSFSYILQYHPDFVEKRTASAAE